MAPQLNTTGKTPIPVHKASLALVSGSRPQKLTLGLLLHFLYIFLPNVCECQFEAQDVIHLAYLYHLRSCRVTFAFDLAPLDFQVPVTDRAGCGAPILR